MNKWSALLGAGVLLAALSQPAAAAAEQQQKIRVYVDGKPLAFAIQPVLDSGTTLVQFRPIFEKLGLTLGWNAATQTVTGEKGSLKVQLTIDHPVAYINDEATDLELAPRLVKGNTMVPVRFVSEATGKEVLWDGVTSSIYIKTPTTLPETPAGEGDGTGGEAEPGTNPMPEPGNGSGVEKGSYTYPNGNKYTGELSGGVPEGKGKLYSAGGKLLFDGTFAAGEPYEGKQRSYDDSGRIAFDGNLKDGVASGAGKQYSLGKLQFDGTFEGGERVAGTLFYDNGNKYTGAFDGDLPGGSGKMIYKNGDSYEGDWVNGKREGKGTYTTAKGEKIVGDYANDMMNGLISYYDKNGTLLSVSEYANDKLIRTVDVAGNGGSLPNTSPSTPNTPLKAENERHDKALAQLKTQYTEAKKQLEDQIAQIRKDVPGTYASQTSYNKALSDAQAKQSDLLAKISALSSDPSLASAAARAELNKQLLETQTLIAQITARGAAQQQIEALKNQLSALLTNYTAQVKLENEQHAGIVKQLK